MPTNTHKTISRVLLNPLNTDPSNDIIFISIYQSVRLSFLKKDYPKINTCYIDYNYMILLNESTLPNVWTGPVEQGTDGGGQHREICRHEMKTKLTPKEGGGHAGMITWKE